MFDSRGVEVVYRLWNGRMGPERDDIWVETGGGAYYVAIREGGRQEPRRRWGPYDRDAAWRWVQHLVATSGQPAGEWIALTDLQAG